MPCVFYFGYSILTGILIYQIISLVIKGKKFKKLIITETTEI